MISNRLVRCVEIKLSLDSMVFLVEEVNLILELGHDFFVGFLVIFQIELFEILAALVEATQPKNFVVSSFNLAFRLFKSFL